MIQIKELKKIAKARLKDSEELSKNRRYDGSVYLCGYAVEVALKARICKTLKWSGFPETRKEFENFKSFKTHNLDVLLRLSGMEASIKTKCLAEWSIVVKWDPEARYKTIGKVKMIDARKMISSTKSVMGEL